MSKDSPITFAHRVFWGEHKLIHFEVDGGQDQILAWNLQWTLWADADKESAALITKSTGDGVTVVDSALGMCQVLLTADDWDEVSPGNSYYYELWRVDVNFEQNLASGEFYVR